MADTAEQPAAIAAPPKRKKRTLAFLANLPAKKEIPDTVFDDDFDDKKDDDKDDDSDDGLGLFKRSNRYFSIAMEAEEERRKSKTKDRKSPTAKEERKSHSLERTPENEASVKRRKLSTDEQKDAWAEEDDIYGATPPRKLSKSPSPFADVTKSRSTPSRWKGKEKEVIPIVRSDILPTPSRSNSRQPATPGEAINLDDDDDDDDFVFSSPRTRSTKRAATRARSNHVEIKQDTPVVLDDDQPLETATNDAEDEEDDEFAHFIKRAQARKAANEAAAARSSMEMSPDAQPKTPGTALPKRGAVVRIFVHSRISHWPEIDLFGSLRGIDQKLKAVRETFMARARQQGVRLTSQDEDSIFLTWKGLKIYDSSSGLSLGWKTSADGRLLISAADGRDRGFAKNGILLEAWTEEDYSEWRAAEERQKKLDRGELEEEEPEVEEIEEEVVPEEVKIKVLLREKDQDPVKTTAYMSTPVSILIAAYRKQRNIPEAKLIRLRNEGDWLEPEQTVEEADIEDRCTVEVYVT